MINFLSGLIHHAIGDHVGGNQALNSATRSSVVLASGAMTGITAAAASSAGIICFLKIFYFHFLYFLSISPSYGTSSRDSSWHCL